MRIDGSGNVGIGTSSPENTLHIKKNASGSSYAADGGDLVIIENNSSAGIDLRTPTGDAGAIYFSDTTRARGAIIYYHSLDDMYFNVAGTSGAMVLNSSGNVGIGTTSPSSEFHVKGDATTLARIEPNDSSGKATLLLSSTSVGDGGIQYDSNSNLMHLFSYNYMTFNVGTGNISGGYPSNERMRIDSSGNLLVGTTTLGDVNNIVNGHLFEAANSTAGEGAVGVYNNTGTANCPALLVLNRDTSTDSTNRFVQFYANVTSAGATAMGGIVGNGASNVQFATLSDEREKENITPVDNVLDKLMNLNVVSFDWKKNDEHVKAGFIAQNVEKHFPEYVIENIANDGEEPRKGTTGGMSAGYIAVLTKAIQEQQAQIEALQSEINLLKGE
jgi:hypothetical protein